MNEQRTGIAFVMDLVDLRIEGLTFGEIAKKIGAPKATIYKVYKEAGKTNYGNYAPIPLDELKEKLDDRNLSLEDIRLYYGVREKGLRNYMLDRNIRREPTIRDVARRLKSGETFSCIMKYYGVSYVWLQNWLKQNGVLIDQFRE